MLVTLTVNVEGVGHACWILRFWLHQGSQGSVACSGTQTCIRLCMGVIRGYMRLSGFLLFGVTCSMGKVLVRPGVLRLLTSNHNTIQYPHCPLHSRGHQRSPPTKQSCHDLKGTNKFDVGVSDADHGFVLGGKILLDPTHNETFSRTQCAPYARETAEVDKISLMSCQSKLVPV